MRSMKIYPVVLPPIPNTLLKILNACLEQHG